mmetsp:Transcript_15490/g.27743  ORF Transcript_15490/g.27743 Transcript_15490/m.27743 type:complete len:298 (+) Transcript_15490:88-981(+)|eukprot:CAMPEP_0196141734 /NCGR_PEP_ID=MMETSP0910-20130528/10364_1 /TAXON_ID=49265 /ORGANISM="Thalassiosira rotula, Strain GSO102" /LENGTH=297 /DNA_ID=CAMNT_0041402933 /DNA_START=68 /DNA_END=961 /DNA_ORIENTATION=+
MTTSYYSTEHHDLFDMDDIAIHDQPFDIGDEYGEFVDLDSDDDTIPAVHLSSDEESGAPSITVCGSRIEDTNTDSLVTSPPILTSSMVDAIVEEGLPWSMQDTQWERLFASTRDGTSFGTFMRRVRGHGQTIIVAKTSDGRILGGYATNVWSGRKQPADSHDDASNAFLFVVDQPPVAKTNQAVEIPAGHHTFIPGLGELGTSPTSAFDFDLHHHHHQPSVPEKPHVEILKPSHTQHTSSGLKQACQLGRKFISMSDGDGNLSLVIENSFSRGVARTHNDSEEFAVVEFEVYGFSED